MAAEWDVEIVVYIWRHHKLLNFLPSSHFGHAAIKMRGVPGTNEAKTLISWWPGEGGAGFENAFDHLGVKKSTSHRRDKMGEMRRDVREKLHDGTFTPRTGQQFKDNEWMQQPDAKIHIPGVGATGSMFGLNLVRMYEWWKVFSTAPNIKYKLVSKRISCAGVAALALKSAGGEQFAKPPKAIFYLDPNQIQHWAEDIRAKILLLNQTVTTVQSQPKEFQEELSMDLPTVQEWKTMSDEGMGKFSVRRQQVLEIDRLLTDYWLTENHNNMQTRVEFMARIMEQIHDHMVHKPQSKRSDAIMALGKRVISVLKLCYETGYRQLGEQPSWLG